MNTSPEPIFAYLRDNYGIRDAEITQNRHRKLRFTYSGKSFTVTLAVSSGDADWYKIKTGEIRNLLGPPPPAAPRARRTLEEMTSHLRPLAALPEKEPTMPTDFAAHLALRDRRFVLTVPVSALEVAGWDTTCGIEVGRADSDRFELVPATRPRAATFQRQGDDRMLDTMLTAALLADLPTSFKKSPVRCTVNPSSMMIMIDRSRLVEPVQPAPESKTRAPKAFARVSFDEIDAIRLRLGMKVGEFSTALGYSPGAHSGWSADGSAPLTALLAAQMLEHRARPSITTARRYIMTVSGNGTVLSTTEMSANLEEMTLGGRRYLLLPVEDKQ